MCQCWYDRWLFNESWREYQVQPLNQSGQPPREGDDVVWDEGHNMCVWYGVPAAGSPHRAPNARLRGFEGARACVPRGEHSPHVRISGLMISHRMFVAHDADDGAFIFSDAYHVAAASGLRRSMG